MGVDRNHPPQANEANGQGAWVAFDPDLDPDPVPTPCINVCKLDADQTFCTGCLRTRDELSAWRSLDDRGRRDVWRRLLLRRAVGRESS